MNEALKNKLDNLPNNPGVYLFKNDKGKIIYVGKAKILKNRVRSYFTGGTDGRAQYENLTQSICDLEVIITETEVEALILEANMIKRCRPRFNVFFRDDKFFPFLKITKELYPRAFLTRKVIKDGSVYYGPFTEVKQVKRLIKIFKSAFQIRNCNLDITEDSIDKKKHKICLDYHIELCGGPCEGLVRSDKYGCNIKRLINLVRGDVSKVIKELRAEMNSVADELKYEYAAKLRDRLKIVEEFASRQTIIFPDKIDRDVFGLAVEDNDGCIALMKVRSGRVQGREHFYLKGSAEKPRSEIISAMLKQYYSGSDYVPREIYLPAAPDDDEVLLTWLKNKRRAAIDLLLPRRGKKLKLLRLAIANAELLLGEKRRETENRDRVPHSIKSLREALNLQTLPRVIEAFDISNLQGKQTSASMVVFKDGKPLKSQYRKFNIRTVEGIDDFASMAEVVKRRYKRVLDEDGEMPDLILIDGGKGQLSSALKSLRDLDITDQPIIGLAKKLEEIFTPFDPEPVNLKKTSSALKLLQQVRDEAHRVAVTHHRKRRTRYNFASTLDNIPGVGEKRKETLLQTFGSVKNIAVKTADDLAGVPGIDKRTAENIVKFFQN
ncbi:MAG: excinuclease ABC subunit C [FCB group bacterium]|nr:excinuclease ABC subunit C [FCB group bacterium]